MPSLGKNGAFYFNGSNLSGDGNNLAMDVSVDVLEATVFGKNWKVYKEGLASAQLTYNAFWLGDNPLSTPSALTAASGAAGNVNVGTHSYKVTLVSSTGETLPSVSSNVVTITSSAKQVDLTNIPVGGASCIARKIYRTVAGDTGSYLLVGTINNNTATVYTDNIADGSLGAAAPSANTTGANDYLFHAAIGAQADGLPFIYYVDKETSLGVKYSGLVIMDRLSRNSRPSDLITIQASFRVSDTLTRATVV